MIPKHVTLSPHLVKFIERKATRDNTSFSEALRRVLDEYVDAVARGDIGGGKKE